MSAATKKQRAVEYRGHSLTYKPDSAFANLFGGVWYSVSGPRANGGTGSGLKGAKRMVDDAIRRHECMEATGHKNREQRGEGAAARMFCKDCGALLGYPYHPGLGAQWKYWRTAANGHDYGYSIKADTEGKWFAIDRPKSAKAKPRLVKCATRAKAKAKATKWWNDAEAAARARKGGSRKGASSAA